MMIRCRDYPLKRVLEEVGHDWIAIVGLAAMPIKKWLIPFVQVDTT
ncbi:hypothetical protein QO002_005671 [Pararhizobium capsulatum DSM 1112]|uniref:Uncharacterized protein n=1 Tax=Pararhizobium capsulatum DSM 1112 TaxID=1121113 RepID=A0ABU0C1C0_9HYPH|nr:hypothetical protein [Pararhizobium capsulatum DSM 1112]